MAENALTTQAAVEPVIFNTGREAELSVGGERFHHLDAVRGFALLLGVLFHAAESFGPGNTYWAIVDCSSTQVLEDVRFACHAFRLELFYLIAGFFARLLLVRRGPAGFVTNRFLRIFVPLVVGWVLLYPILVFVWTWGAAVSGRLEAAGVPPEVRNLPLWKLTLGFFLTGEFIRRFDLTHLWFLHQLLVLYLIALALKWVAGVIDRSGKQMIWVDRFFARVVRSSGALPALALPSIPMLLLMNSWGVDTPKESLMPHLPTTLLFGYFFFLGWLCHRQPVLLEALARRWASHMACGLLAWISFGVVQTQVQWTRLPWTCLYGVMMWGLVLGFLGLFTRFCQRASAWTRYLADSSYWVYVVHLPLVVALQVEVGRWAAPWPVKYLLICTAALVVLYLSYHYLVRSTFIGAQLNGRRYPRIWPWQGGSRAES
jgi:glucans biosynthesis protein C